MAWVAESEAFGGAGAGWWGLTGGAGGPVGDRD